ncbi:MAG: heat-inducible transcriptional repressor HrcA [Jiangellales bacterium]
MLDDRKVEVLRAIVEDYVATREPVGSKALVDRHSLGVSSATVRNDMAVLEEEGYIAQPHTSAGRIPTDKGYRVFVDRLSGLKPLSVPERRAISTFLEGAVDLDEIVTRSVRLLAQLTRQIAVVQYPLITRSTIRHVEIVAMAGTRVLLVVITENGRVDQTVVELPAELDAATLAGLRDRLNAQLAGQRLAEVSDRLADITEQFAPEHRASVASMVAALLENIAEAHDERVAVAGTANITAYGREFETGVRPLLEALEEHVVLLHLVGEAASPLAVSVRIGSENEHIALTTSSVVSSSYGTGGELLGSLGVVGPLPMDYPGTMATVRAVARYVSQILAE